MSDNNVEKLEDADNDDDEEEEDEENGCLATTVVSTVASSRTDVEENVLDSNCDRNNAGTIESGRTSVQNNVLKDEKLKDPNSTVVQELMGPPELRRNDESRPGAFRSGGNLGTTAESSGHELLESAPPSAAAHPHAADLVLHAELVNETPVEYVQAEPLSLSAGDDEDREEEYHESERRRILFMRKLKHRYFPIATLIAGLFAILIGVVMTTIGSDNAKESTLPAHAPGMAPMQQERVLVSLHAVVWGYRTDCDEFETAPLQIDCQGQVEVLLTDDNTSDCSTPGTTITTCDLENSTAVVIFRCLNRRPDMPLQATVTFPEAKASKCRNRQPTQSKSGLRKLSSSSSSSIENATFGGTAETFLALGRFCEQSGTLTLHSNYNFEYGVTPNRITQGWQGTSSLPSTSSQYCYSNATCEQSTSCQSNEQCDADCSIDLTSLSVSDADDNCFIASGHGDGAIDDSQLRHYLKIVHEQMLQYGPSYGSYS